MGDLSAFDYLGYNEEVYSRTALTFAILYIYSSNRELFKILQKPIQDRPHSGLSLTYNAIDQLNIINNDSSIKRKPRKRRIAPKNIGKKNYDSIFSVLDEMFTNIGRQRLIQLHSRPLIDHVSLNNRYNILERLIKNDKKKSRKINTEIISDYLRDIKGISTYQDTFSQKLRSINSFELYKMIHIWSDLSDLLKIVNVPHKENIEDDCIFDNHIIEKAQMTN